MVTLSYWSDLPSELLDLVATHFDSSSDTRHFRSVCSEWRFAIPRPISTRFPPMKFFNTSDVQHCDIQLEKHIFYHLSQSSNPGSPGWLIKAEENNPGSVRLFNPFSRSPIKHLRPFNFPKQLDLTNMNIRELDHEYVLRNVSGNTELFNMEHEKVAMTTSSSDSSNDFVILSTHDTGKLFMYQSVQQIGSILDDPTLGYDNRSIYVNDWSMHYVDVMELNGTFYAVTNSGRTVAINGMDDYSTVKVTLLKNSIIGGDKKCLVKLSDDLLMVDFYTDTTPSGSIKILAVEIFKLDKEGQKWELLKSLRDHALFISNHSSFSAVGMPGCKGNCIYFRFGSFDKNKCCLDTIKEGFCEEKNGFEWKSEEIGVFDFEKGVVGILEEYLDNSQLFSWPPPSWVFITSNSK